jgi:hypothetical protein
LVIPVAIVLSVSGARAHTADEATRALSSGPLSSGELDEQPIHDPESIGMAFLRVKEAGDLAAPQFLKASGGDAYRAGA